MANDFDESRARPWPGWVKLLDYIGSDLRVLDLGCGNGRLGVYLAERIQHYTGVDNNAFLLGQASASLTQIPHTLIQADVLEAIDLNPPYDLIAVFGVMHHVPSFERRRQLIVQQRGMLAPKGILALTFWEFYKQERFRERIVDWQDDRVPPMYHDLELEPGDYLLDWRQGAYALRYCHHVADDERARLLADLPIRAEYEADTANRYVLIDA